MQLFTVDQDAKTLKPYGAGIPVEISATGGISEGFAVGISPVDGTVISAQKVKSDLKPVIAYLDESLQWSSFPIETETASGTTVQIAYDKDGKAYVSYMTEKGIQLYSVGLEADILPE